LFVNYPLKKFGFPDNTAPFGRRYSWFESKRGSQSKFPPIFVVRVKCESTDAAADLLDDLHVRFQSNRRIVLLPRDTAFRPDGWIQRPEHDILVLEFFDLLWHESNTQSCGYCMNHSSFKIDILQNLGGKASAVARFGEPLAIKGIAGFGD